MSRSTDPTPELEHRIVGHAGVLAGDTLTSEDEERPDGLPPFPYPGLRPFQPEEAPIFFGRGQQVAEMITRLEDHRFLAVVGASGSGKSSLVRAGLLPALEQGFLAAASDQWRMVLMRPGEAPLHNLARELLRVLPGGPPPNLDDEPDPHRAGLLQVTLRSGPKGIVQAVQESGLPPDTNLLILVDQFEELFRFRHRRQSDTAEGGNVAVQRDEAAAFVSLLLATVTQSERPIYVVITMRSDFLGDCDAFFGLPEAINDSQFLTPRLTREQARAAIEEPARLYDGRVEPALVNRILNEIGNDPDQLPLMQHSLMRAWRHAWKTGGGAVTLRLDQYLELGGLHKSLDKHADYVLASLRTDEDRRVAEMLFRSLCDRSAEQRLTRRLATVAEIAAVADVSTEAVIRVADAFRHRGRSFLVPPEEIPLTADRTLDISHESLIRQWGTLQTWLEREERTAAIYRRLSETARLWQAGEAGLYRPPELDIALQWKEQERPTPEWAERYAPGAFADAETFLNHSHQAAVNESWKRWARRIGGSVIAVTIIFLVLLVWGLLENRRADIAEYKALREMERVEEVETKLDEAETKLRRTVDLTTRQRIRPVAPGTSVSHVNATAGTICCIVQDKNGQNFLLSAEHTLAPENAQPGDPVIQPGAFDGGDLANDQVAELAEWIQLSSSPRQREAGAIAKLLPGVQANNVVPGIGAIQGIGDVELGTVVQAVGRTSPLLRGVVTGVDVDVQIVIGPGRFALLAGVFTVKGSFGPFSLGGDSGAPVLTEDGRLVGMIYAGSLQETIVIPIRTVFDALDVELARADP